MALTPVQILARELEAEKAVRSRAFADVEEAQLVLDLKRQRAAACERRVQDLLDAIQALKDAEEQGK